MSDVTFLDYQVSARGKQEDAKRALGFVKDQDNKARAVQTINAHSTCVAQDDAVFSEALKKADLLIPDGISIVKASRLLGNYLPERVSGYDFFETFSKLANEDKETSYFFIGSSEEVLEKISNRVKSEYPNITIVGTYSPPFKPEFSEEDNAQMCAAINEAKPDVLWVGMTAPKQEKWIEENRSNLNVGFAAAIGAVFDFYAGTKERAPLRAQKMGLEWAHRLVTEPTRVWRRYIINNPRFIYIVLKRKFGSK